MFLVFFFFSSRRRHTRSYGDWSSDVCSSDLGLSWLAGDNSEDTRRMPDTKTPSQSKTVSHLGHLLTGNETTSTRARNKQSRNDAFLGTDHGVVRPVLFCRPPSVSYRRQF